MPAWLYTAVGFLGPALFLWAYLMISLGRWTTHMMKPHVINLFGALAILVSLVVQWNAAVFVLELAWGAISVYGIIRARSTRA